MPAMNRTFDSMGQSMRQCPLVSPALQEVARWWISNYEPDRALPSRGDIDHFALRHTLPHLWLVEYLPDDETFRYRLAGEHVNGVFGQSLRGKVLADFLEPHILPTVRERFLHVQRTPGAVYAVGRVYMHAGRYREGERLILPLSDDGIAVTHLLGVTDYGAGYLQSAEPPPPDYMDEVFLTIEDLLAWRSTLIPDRRAG